jgi:hypothetical protein
MILLGLILVAVAIAAGVVLVVQNANDIRVHVFATHYSVHAYWLAVAGLVIMAVFAIGLAMSRAGAARQRRLHRERRDLARENQRLSEQIETGAPSTHRVDSDATDAPSTRRADSDATGTHPDWTATEPPGDYPSAPPAGNDPPITRRV